jgi:hypothetical protein
VSKSLGCFSSYYAAGETALFSMNNYFNYNGFPKHAGVTAGMILLNQYLSGASAGQAFQALGAAGYSTDTGYGANVSKDIGVATSIENCLRAIGQLP